MEREDTKDKSQEERGEGEEEKADKRMEHGREHPGKRRTRTGTSEGQRPWAGTSGEEAAINWTVRGCIRRRTRQQQETARRTSTRARKVEREDKKKKSREQGGEGEEGEADPDWNIRGTHAHGLEPQGGGGPGLEHPG